MYELDLGHSHNMCKTRPYWGQWNISLGIKLRDTVSLCRQNKLNMNGNAIHKRIAEDKIRLDYSYL